MSTSASTATNQNNNNPTQRSTTPPTSSSATGRAYFESQRAELVREIGISFEQVLQNINRLNRNLESIIAVGNEFGSVEALWSTFEGVMGTEGEEEGNIAGAGEKVEGKDTNREGRKD